MYLFSALFIKFGQNFMRHVEIILFWCKTLLFSTSERFLLPAFMLIPLAILT